MLALVFTSIGPTYDFRMGTPNRACLTTPFNDPFLSVLAEYTGNPAFTLGKSVPFATLVMARGLDIRASL